VEGWEDGQWQSSAHQAPAVTDEADVRFDFWLHCSNEAAYRDEDGSRVWRGLRGIVLCSTACIGTQLLASVVHGQWAARQEFDVVRG
jgi:hypothetical protein